MFWHQCFGHLKAQYLRNMQQENFIFGVKKGHVPSMLMLHVGKQH
jgi:hypothetical protein